MTTPRPTTSASNVFRRLACPGSHRLEDGLPEDQSPQADEGNILHKHDADRALDRSVLTLGQRDLLETSAELEDAVIENTMSAFGIGANEPYLQGPEEELVVHRGIRIVLTGHCDKWRYFYKRRLLVLIDKKFGFIPVTPAAANPQLRVYAIGGAERWASDHIVVAITQPRLPREERMTLATYTAEDIEAARVELYGIMAKAAEPDAPLVPGEEQCRYCKAKAICPAYRQSLAVVNQIIPATTDADAPALQTALERCTPGEIDTLLRIVMRADFIRESLREHARGLVAGGKLPGWKLGKAVEIRTVTDAAAAAALLSTAQILNHTEALECADLSLTKLQGRVREKTGCTWKVAKDLVNSTLEPVIERTEKKQALQLDL